jgi:hypothetical protein
MAVVLLVGSGLLARTLHRVSQTDLGMEPKGLVVQPINLPATTPDPEALLAMQRLLEQVGAAAGVEQVAAIYPSPSVGRASPSVHAPRAVATTGRRPSTSA